MEWIRGPKIGEGATAMVYLATTISSSEKFAVKSVQLSSSNLLQKEKEIMAVLNSPYIVKYMCDDISYEKGEHMYNLFMEYLPGGTIMDSIKKHGGWLDESIIRSYTRQIVHGLDYIHMNNLVHCDIKSSNILVGKDAVKLADFGCAKIDETSILSGTPVFMAPEVARGEEQSFPADIWALGCTIIEMATGCSNPWPEVNDPVSALYKIGFSNQVPEFPSLLSENAKDFLSKCLTRDHKVRWTAKQLLHHPFLENDFDSSFPQMVKETTKSSPTGVLDQDFWDSFEHVPSTQFSSSNSSNSPIERIGKLIENSLFSSSSVPDWPCDENWITIRSNIEPKDKDSGQIAEPGPSSIIHEDEIEDLSFNRDLFILDLLFEEFVVNCNGEVLRDCDSLVDCFVLKRFKFESNNEISCYIQIQFLLFRL